MIEIIYNFLHLHFLYKIISHILCDTKLFVSFDILLESFIILSILKEQL